MKKKKLIVVIKNKIWLLYMAEGEPKKDEYLKTVENINDKIRELIEKMKTDTTNSGSETNSITKEPYDGSIPIIETQTDKYEKLNELINDGNDRTDKSQNEGERGNLANKFIKRFQYLKNKKNNETLIKNEPDEFNKLKEIIMNLGRGQIMVKAIPKMIKDYQSNDLNNKTQIRNRIESRIEYLIENPKNDGNAEYNALLNAIKEINNIDNKNTSGGKVGKNTRRRIMKLINMQNKSKKSKKSMKSRKMKKSKKSKKSRKSKK